MLALLDRHGRATFDLSIPALSVLSIIEGADEPLTPTTIAERAIVTTASITSLLDTLERRGLVRRQRHPDDRRKVLVEITPEGLAVVDEFLPAARGIEMAVMGGLGEQDRRRLLRTLTKVQQAIAAIEAGEVVPEVYQRRR